MQDGVNGLSQLHCLTNSRQADVGSGKVISRRVMKRDQAGGGGGVVYVLGGHEWGNIPSCNALGSNGATVVCVGGARRGRGAGYVPALLYPQGCTEYLW
jgi:hypothetical protein